MSYIVYKHIFPNGKVYIGMAKNPKLRWGSSGVGYIKEKQPLIYEAILTYGWLNIGHDVIEQYDNREEALTKERELILSHRSNEPEFGYNRVVDGIKKVVRHETRIKMSQSHMGQKLTQESLAKMKATRDSKPKKIKPVKEKITSGWGRGVLQIDRLTKEVIREWKNVKEASEALAINQCGISKCCNGKITKSGGYIWQYLAKN